MATFRVNDTQVLTNVHEGADCSGTCVIHHPMPGPWSDWELIWRPTNDADLLFGMYRGFERICPHGAGHPAAEEVARRGPVVHGCDGCPCTVGTWLAMEAEEVDP